MDVFPPVLLQSIGEQIKREEYINTNDVKHG